jgi:TolA-binding protein
MGLEIILAIFAIVSAVIVSVINAISINKLNSKVNISSANKMDVETNILTSQYKSNIIKDLQSQIDELRLEVELVKKKEHIQLQEKIRLEQEIAELKHKNEKLQVRLKLSDDEIARLINQIKSLNIKINNLEVRK